MSKNQKHVKQALEKLNDVTMHDELPTDVRTALNEVTWHLEQVEKGVRNENKNQSERTSQ